jgi:predicted dehydrogenase
MKALVIGYGSIGKRHVENLVSYKNYDVIIVTKQKDIPKMRRVKIFDNLDDAINEKPKIALITNETRFHIQVATKLAKNEINLFIEKPLSDSLKGITTLQKIIKKKKLVTMVGCNFRFFPPIMNIKKIISRNEIGRIISVQVENGSYLPDWHPYEDYSKGYAARKKLGGGVILTQIHELDYLRWFFGLVSEVRSFSGKFSDLDIDVDDTSASILKFKNNVICELHLDFFQRPQFKRCKIRGTKGIIEWDSDSNNVRVFNLRIKKWKKVNIKNNYNLKSKTNINRMYKDELKHFLKCVESKRKTINTFRDAVNTLKIALAMKRSSKFIKVRY